MSATSANSCVVENAFADINVSKKPAMKQFDSFVVIEKFKTQFLFFY